MSKLAHSSDFHMSLIDAQSLIDSGESILDVVAAMIDHEYIMSDTAEDFGPREIAQKILEVVKMKPQPQSAA